MPLNLVPYTKVELPPSEENWDDETDCQKVWTYPKVPVVPLVLPSFENWDEDEPCEQEARAVSPVADVRSVWVFEEDGQLTVETHAVKRDEVLVPIAKPDPALRPGTTYLVPYPNAPAVQYKSYLQAREEGTTPKLRFKPKTLRKDPNHRWW